jgi:RimJ/RimL family protein N-acetyltransferase
VGDLGELARDGDLSIRRMRDTDEDYRQLLEWRREPHVRAVWDEDDEPEFSMEKVLAEHGPDTKPGSTSVAAFVELGDRPIGYIQFYPWSAYGEAAREMSIPPDDDAWGLDIFIGDPNALGRGYGSRAVDLLCRYLFATHAATRVALLTAVDNLRAQRAYEKAGMRKLARALDTDVRGGVRVESWLMVREAGGLASQ